MANPLQEMGQGTSCAVSMQRQLHLHIRMEPTRLPSLPPLPARGRRRGLKSRKEASQSAPTQPSSANEHLQCERFSQLYLFKASGFGSVSPAVLLERLLCGVPPGTSGLGSLLCLVFILYFRYANQAYGGQRIWVAIWCSASANGLKF